MSQLVTKSPLARLDLLELADFLAQDSIEVAERFLDAAETTFAFLATAPEAGSVCHFQSQEAAGLRVWAVRGFKNHLVYYRATAGGIDVVRVIHGARDIEAIFSTPAE